jgi:DNA polymerase-3 subunit delta'
MSLRDIIGHRRLAALISRAIDRESLPPTLLFAGPSGVGKWRVAVATAQALNCLEPIRTADALPVDACGRCRACDRIARGMHVDVIALEPDDRASIKVDVVRDVLTRTGYRPFEGKRRVVMIREADTLEESAQNSLLKNLEEPPPGTIFILTTAVPGALLSTVRSRCMRLRFGRLTATEVTTALVRDHELSEMDARAAAPLADGSIGQALSLSDNDLSDLRDSAMRLLQQTSGRADTQTRLQAATALVAGPSKKERSREDLAVLLRLTASMLRDIEALNSGADERVLANPLLTDDLSTLARAFAGDRARAAFGAVDRALTALERNAGTKVVAEWLAVQI